MGFLIITGPVMREFGERNASALDAGVGLPPDAQCWACGEAINLVAAKPGTVTLSALPAVPGSVAISLFAHRPCSPSRVVPYEEFTATASRKPSPVTEGGEAMIVDGKQVI